MGCSVLALAGAASWAGGLVFGYELAVMSGALLQLRGPLRLSCVQQEALVSALLAGALLASAGGGRLVDGQGRRRSLILGDALVLLGSLVALAGSYAALLLGRLTVGFAVSLSSMSCCILVSEVVSPERRGLLVSLYEGGVTAGVLAAYAVNYWLARRAGGWRAMLALAAAPAALQLLAACFLPPGGAGAAAAAAEKEKEQERAGISFLFGRQENMRGRMLLALALVLLQQASGGPTLLLYASSVLRALGFGGRDSAVLASVGLGLVKAASTLGAALCSDRAGRRPLLLAGCGLMALGLLAVGLLSGGALGRAHNPCSSEADGTLAGNQTFPQAPAFVGNQTHLHAGTAAAAAAAGGGGDDGVPEASQRPQAALKWLILLGMMTAVSAFSFSFGPLTWLLLSEIFPEEVRGRAFAFSSCFNWAANLLVTFTFLDVTNAVGLSGTFILYGVTSLGAGVFFYFLLPETKGKTLEQIDQELRSNRFDGCRCGCVGCWGVCGDAPPRYQRLRYQVSSAPSNL